MRTQSIEGAMPPLPRKVIVAISGNGTEGRREYFGYDEASMHAYAAPLLARVAELEKDAARYRWLFSDGPTHTPIASTPSMSQSRGPYVRLDPPSVNSFSGMVLDKTSADQFIDAALAAHKEQP